MSKNLDTIIDNRHGSLFDRIASLIERARVKVATAVNTAEVYTKYHVGQYIVEDEQEGKERAEYGKAVLKELSVRLTEKFGDGWSYATLKNTKQFYLLYSERLNSVHPIQNKKAKQCLANSTELPQQTFRLSWSHYLVLMRIKDVNARSFYEIECVQQNWSVRQLQRQYNSSLYERLALSHNKNEVMRLAVEGA